MATLKPADNEQGGELAPAEPGFGLRFQRWLAHDFVYLLGSTVVHVILLVLAALVTVRVVPTTHEAPSFEATSDQTAASSESEAPLERFELAETPLEPSELSTETLTLEPPAQLEQAEQINDDNPVFSERGGGMASASDSPVFGMGGLGVEGAVGPGPAVSGSGVGGSGKGTGSSLGAGGSGIGFGGRGTGMRKAMLGRYGGTKQSERAVAGALNWLARHQMPDGSWSLGQYTACCKKGGCSGVGASPEPGAGTALGLLPFLGAGQTHQSQGPYRKTIHAGISWLVRHQGADGDLRVGGTMYSHGLATITLCEASALSRDTSLALAAQKAVAFIEAAQHPDSGGWRYAPRSLAGDTSVLGWQVMALKSAQMAGLRVNPAALEAAGRFLDSVAWGEKKEQFYYQPEGEPRPSMTAVGLLCRQYMGMARENPTMAAGIAYLMAHPPDANQRDIYYWYYATQVVHNYSGPDWDAWNRKMRRILIESQDREGCASGSWDPLKPIPDAYGPHGGRVMTTSLSALTLEIYYRYLPLYKFDLGSPSAEAAEPSEPFSPPSKPRGTGSAKAEKSLQGKPGVSR